MLPPQPVSSLHAHDAYYGANPPGSKALIAELERSGLRGRGGAGFPTATKLAAVARGRKPVVVVNATEGEPASRKDAVLSSLAPHLILDGAVLAAGAVGAAEVHVCVERRGESASATMMRAVEERALAKRDQVAVRLHEAPNRYVAGEESALVNWLNGGEAKPTFVPPRPFERGVRGRPTLVQNAETLAHLALIARHGAAWFRELGTEEEPGTALLTVTGAVAQPGVCEVPVGYPLVDVLGAAGTAIGEVSAVLVGGYFGTWLSPAEAARTTYDRASLGAVEACPGCGVVAALSRDTCGLLELARVARWLANQNAGQCGPCVNGLPAIADAVEALYAGDRSGGAERQLRRWLEMVQGRGACKHPDGVARFVGSGLRAFADDIERHRRHGPCPTPHPVLPVPATGGWR
jgi:NADH:ubiquinone oxidoreductase subunit F (NADH-binding)